MLPCVCSLIDHRRRQNVVRTSVTHSAIASCATFLFLLHFDVFCDLLLNRRIATWDLFVLYNKETNYNRISFFIIISKSFNITRKPAIAPHSAHFHEKSHLTLSIIYTNDAISLVAMLSKTTLIDPRKPKLTRASLHMK